MICTAQEAEQAKGQLVLLHDQIQEIQGVADREKRSLTELESDFCEKLNDDFLKIESELLTFDSRGHGRKADPESPQAGPKSFSRTHKSSKPDGKQHQYQMPDGTPVVCLSSKEKLTDKISQKGEPLSLAKTVLGMVTGDFSNAPLEYSAIQNQSISTGTDGGFLAPTTISSQIIDVARNKTRCIQAGASTLVMPSGEMTVVKVDSDPTSSFKKENASITASNAVFGKVHLVAQTLGCLIKVSEEMLQDAPNANQLLSDLIGESLALEIDRVGLFGSGKNEPRGLYYTSGLGEVDMGTNGAAFTNYVPFLDSIEDVETANGEALATVYSPRTKRALSGLVTGISGDNTPLPIPADVQALNRFTTNQVPNTLEHGTASNASCAIVGDYSQMAFGIRQDLRLAANYGDDGFGKFQIHIRGTLRLDVAVFRPSHFSKITGIIPS